MATIRSTPRIKFTYGNRPSRLNTLTIQDDSDSSDESQDQQPVEKAFGRLTKANKTTLTTKSHSKHNHQPSFHSTIELSKKRKRSEKQLHNTVTATRRVSDRLKSNSPTKRTAQATSSSTPPLRKHNREATPVDNDLLLMLQVQKPQTSLAQTSPPPARPVNQSPQSTKKSLLPSERSSPRRVANKKPQIHPDGGHARKGLPGEDASQHRITRNMSHRSLVLSETTQLPPQPVHSELRPPPCAHKDHHISPPPNLPHQSPGPRQSNQPHESDTRDHSDIFAIIESSYNCNHSEEASLNPSRKKARVALMGGKTISRSGLISPLASPGCSRPPSPIARSANRILGRVLSSNSSSDLFGPSARTSTLTLRKPLARQLSSDLPPIPVNHEVVNTANLANMFSGVNAIKKTYGGERTFKQDENELKLLLPLSTTAPSRTSKRSSATPAKSSRVIGSLKRFQSRETYSELRKKWGVDEDDEPPEAQADLQTIIHQRASGSSKRFADELSYLIEGLMSGPDQPDLSIQRSSAIVLIKKLKEQLFLDELRSNGLIEHFYNSLRAAGAGDGDPILDHALLIFISLLCCQDQKFIEPVLRIIPKGSAEVFSMQSDCLQLLGTVAGRDYPQVTLKERSNFRRHPSLACQIQEVVEGSALRKHFTRASSPGLLALFSLARIAMFVPRPGLLPQRFIVHCKAFASVITCLKVYGEKLDHLFNSFAPHQREDFSAGDGQNILKHIGYCMDVIEACTVCEEDALNSIDMFRQSLGRVCGSLISLCHRLARHEQSEISMTALDILIGCLRTMVNLTNYNSSWASELSTPSVLQALCGLLAICREGYNQHRSSPYMVGNQEPPNVPVDHLLDPSSTVNQFQHTNPPSLIDNRVDEVVFDLLCVCLGLLANLLEQSAQATDMLRQTHVPTTSTAQQPTLHPYPICGFEELMRLYINPPCRKLDEKKFIRGSISVLINLSLLNGFEDQSGDIDDSYQSITELEIIKSFKRILQQVGSELRYQDEVSEQEYSCNANGGSLGIHGALDSGKLWTKSEMIKSFLGDLKLHSGASSSLSAHSDYRPIQTLTSTAGSLPLEPHQTVLDHLQILNSCWNRLRVELI